MIGDDLDDIGNVARDNEGSIGSVEILVEIGVLGNMCLCKFWLY